jgi:hypothetical protein
VAGRPQDQDTQVSAACGMCAATSTALCPLEACIRLATVHVACFSLQVFSNLKLLLFTITEPELTLRHGGRLWAH